MFQARNAFSGQVDPITGDLTPVKQAYTRTQSGLTIGGPIKIPKVYDGHDKTFFFFNFEQFRETTITNNVPVTVPTLAHRDVASRPV